MRLAKQTIQFELVGRDCLSRRDKTLALSLLERGGTLLQRARHLEASAKAILECSAEV